MRPLVHDGALAVQIDTELLPLVQHWFPNHPPAEGGSPAPVPGELARIQVTREMGEMPLSTARPTLRLDPVGAWVDDECERVMMRGATRGCGGRIDLAERRAVLHAPDDHPAVGADLYSMLTLSAAFLLGRLERTLTHAAAVVGPRGGAWLLPGDSHAGKSTTCATLIGGGWDYLADDTVVLFTPAGGTGVWVEGWPRTFQLDEGWERGVSLGRRAGREPQQLGPGRIRRTARVAGLLFPRVDPQAPTTVVPLAPAEAFARLLRRTPWLLADRSAAGTVLELLKRVVALPASELRLGWDTYRNPGRLLERLTPVIAAG